MAKATYRADGRVEVVTVNAAGTETRTAFHLGSPIVSTLLVQQLNEAFDAAADDDESDMPVGCVNAPLGCRCWSDEPAQAVA